MRRKRIRRLMRTMALGPKRMKALHIWRQTLPGDGTKTGKSNHFSKCCSTGLRVLRCRAGDREINQGDLVKQLGTRVNHSIAYPALLLELDPASATMLRQMPDAYDRSASRPACAASGHAAAPPTSNMNSRRLMIVPPDPEAREFRPQTVRWPITSRAIQISKHAPMNPAIR